MMDHIVSTNIKTNQVDDAVDNELKFDGINSLSNNYVQDPLPMVTISLRVSKKSRQTLNSGLTLLWQIGSTDIMIKPNNVNPNNSKLRANKFQYNMAFGPYKTTHDVKVLFIMPQFSNRKIITHRFHIDNAQGDTGVGYEMIIVHYLMVQLGLKENFGRQILEWGETETTMN